MVVDAKKHLHMEKPGGLSLEDFIQMVNVAEKNGTVFHTGYMYRYNPVILSLLERIDKGELGDIISVEAHMSCVHPDPFHAWQNTFPGCGMMFFLGCHLIDLVYRIKGEPKRIGPYLGSSDLDGNFVPDNTMVVLDYETGPSFVKTSDVERGGFLRRQLVVTGTKETFVVEPLEKIFEGDLLTTGYRSITDESWSADGERLVSKPYHRYKDMMLGFASFVRGEKKNPYDYEYERNLRRLVQKCCNLEEY
jgi:predicted dehydrogenase